MNLFPVFLVGLMGSVHCLAMCGGIVGALSTAGAARAAPLVRYKVSHGAMLVVTPAAINHEVTRVLSYNLGRLASYAMAGALAGGIAAGMLRGADVLGWMLPLQRAATIAVNLMLVALGLHLGQWWSGVARLERLGQRAWRAVRPLTSRLLPVDSAGKALLLGGLWGWLPCGMVYSALLTAMLAGDATQGALTMLAFGAGTLPMLVAAGLSGAGLRTLAAGPGWRRLAGLVVLGFGVLGLLRAAEFGSLGIARGWLDVLCITPAHGALP
ncbi:sulfite exporter TauE/SafE family protein [Herbaspirillum sp. alder98]|uniref:sulfite exporter TauE/SafE family protein n=1 Tax=Herbaspirillum sp. alder98 TaxID=2913096 RepID=UPI001CD8C660|nr:sulfite exporter TauE/SafE family protein [Herbaspirillum sp. alder98]MCA1323045.1 sulfite exporter TauE/SafE family protein [Herbaspirillum sp. alder98]